MTQYVFSIPSAFQHESDRWGRAKSVVESGIAHGHSSLVVSRRQLPERKNEVRNHYVNPTASCGEGHESAVQQTHRCVVGVDELAEYLAVPSSWIYDNHHRLELPAMKLGRHLRFRKCDVDAWLETRKRLAG